MLSEILVVFVITIISSIFLSTTYVHGLPTSLSTFHSNSRSPSADLSSSLRPFRHHPIASIDYDLGGDISQMLTGENNELSTMTDYDDDSSLFTPSFDESHEPLDFYRHSSSSKSLSRKLLSLLNKQNPQKQVKEANKKGNEQQQKRSQSSLTNTSPSLPTPFNFNSASATGRFADPSHTNGVADYRNLSESTRLSPSLQILVEKNPIARAWLTLLIKQIMEEQPVPYIFKYGRRRKK